MGGWRLLQHECTPPCVGTLALTYVHMWVCDSIRLICLNWSTFWTSRLPHCPLVCGQQAPSLSPCVWPAGSLTVPLCVASRLPHCPLVCGQQAPSLSPCVWPAGSLTVPLCVASRLPHCPLVCGQQAPSLSPCVWPAGSLTVPLCVAS